MSRTAPLMLLLLWACSPDRRSFSITAPGELVPALEAFAAPIAFPLTVGTRPGGSGLDVRVIVDLDCGDCYRIEAAGERYTLHAGGLLGAQYALTELLEAYGFGFFSPGRTRVPATLAAPFPGHFGVERRPSLTVRGLDLHTLHPTEAYFAVWEPSEENLAAGRRIFDWVVKNRGNLVTWPGLDDVQRDAGRAAAWAGHTRALIEAAHLRGLRVGFGVQLFGKSNLQKAFDLLDEDAPPQPRDLMRERLRVPLGLGFDSLQLSFGEFSGADPQSFIDRLNDASAVARELSPDLEVTASVHLGKDNTVTFRGETLLYYYLVRYADPRLVPWIHTVMYYDLFEDAGGAYQHDDFSEHRAYLLSRLAAGERAAYFPESAYWVAFDNSVPVYLPLYLRSRWLDLSRLASGDTPLKEHVLFSSGWEWGYWQTDAATLRMSFTLPARYEDALAGLFESYGAAAGPLVSAVAALAEAQHDGLLLHRLAAFYAAEDSIIDAGRALGIVSQPRRPAFSDLAAMSAPERATFRADVLGGLRRLAEATEAAAAQLAASGAPPEEAFIAELVDGFEVDALRARFVLATWSAALAHAEGGDPATPLAEAEAALELARAVVGRRSQAMSRAGAAQLFRPRENQTLYPYGYLFEAQTLCYWDREQVQVRAFALGTTAQVPACIDVDLN